MQIKRPKICTGCRVSAAKIYLYHSTKIAKARPHSVEWQTDSSVQKQWFMANSTSSANFWTFFLVGDPEKRWICTINHGPLLLNRTDCRTLYSMWPSFGYFSTVI